MSPFQHLGLTEEASEIEIKRAYARLLKRHRPEEDPAGFQALHEAYTHCLAFALMPQFWTEDDEIDLAASESAHQPADAQPAEPHRSASARRNARREDANSDANADPDTASMKLEGAAASTVVAPPPLDYDHDEFDSEEFLAEMMGFAAATWAADLAAWLRAHPAMYSLEHKDEVAEELVHYLDEQPPLLPAQMRVLFKFFDLDTINSRSQRLEPLIDYQYRRAVEAAGEWEDVPEMYEQPIATTGSSIVSSWWIWIVLFGVLKMLFALAALGQ